MIELFQVVQHLPDHLQQWAQNYGTGFYAIVATIIFAETGLVVTPLLPGDSLLFAVGAVLSLNLPGLEIGFMIPVLIVSALCGDTLNYHVGRWTAPRLFRSDQARWLNRKHLDRTKEFFAKHGGKTVILARFLPIVRTYAPFVSGLSAMPYSQFFLFSLLGGTLWISLFVGVGYYFGNLPVVRSNFHYAILGIVLVSFAPVVIELIKSRARTASADSSSHS